MGYGEVEAVLPANFIPRPDHPPGKSPHRLIAKTESGSQAANDSSLLAVVYASERDAEAEDAAAGGEKQRRKKKRNKRKKRRGSGRGASDDDEEHTHGGRRSLLRRWRSSRRSKSRSSRRKKDDDDRGAAKHAEGAADEKKSARAKSRSNLVFYAIQTVDSNVTNATERRTNRSRAKQDRGRTEGHPRRSKTEVDAADIEGNAAVLPTANAALATLHKGNPAAYSTGDDGLAAPPISIEVGEGRIEQIAISIEAFISDSEQREDRENGEVKTDLRTGSVKANKYTRLNRVMSSISTMKSFDSLRSSRKEVLDSSTRSVKSDKSISSHESKVGKSNEGEENPSLPLTGSSREVEGHVKSNVSSRFRQMLSKSKSTDTADRTKKKHGTVEVCGEKRPVSVTPEPGSLTSAEEHAPCQEEAEGDRIVAEDVASGVALAIRPPSSIVARGARERASVPGGVARQEGGGDDAPSEDVPCESVQRGAIGREYRKHGTAPSMPDAGLLSLPLPASFCDVNTAAPLAGQIFKSKTFSESIKSGEKEIPTLVSVGSSELSVRSTRSISRSLRKGLTFLNKSKSKNVQEHTVLEEEDARNDTGKERTTTKAAFKTGKGALVAREYQMHVNAPPATDKGLLSLPLPMSFCGDESGWLPLPETEVLSTEKEPSISPPTSGNSTSISSVKFSLASSELTRALSPNEGVDEAGELVCQTSSKDTGETGANKMMPLAAFKDNRAMPALREESTVTDGVGNADATPSFRTEVQSSVSEIDESVLDSDHHLSTKTEIWPILPEVKVLGESGEQSVFDKEQGTNKENPNNGTTQLMSNENLDIGKSPAHQISEASHKFSTREALEDSIAECRSRIQAVVSGSFDADEQALACTALANDEVRKLLHLRLTLPRVADLTEKMGALQVEREGAMQSLDTEKMCNIQSEINKLKNQIGKEQGYLLQK